MEKVPLSLRELWRNDLESKMLVASTIENILTSCITVWFNDAQ